MNMKMIKKLVIFFCYVVFTNQIIEGMLTPTEETLTVGANAKELLGMTELHRVVILENENRFFELLNNKSININAQDDFGRTPLHYAYALLNKYFIRELVNAGARLDIVDGGKVRPFGSKDYNDVLVQLSVPYLCDLQRQRNQTILQSLLHEIGANKS